MKVSKLNLLSSQALESMGLYWHTDEDSSDYISDELISVSQEEAEAFYRAGNELYDMYVETAEYIIKNDLFFDLDIPNSMIPMIRQSFEEDIHWHLYGRFDFAGGLDGQPIKLLEFNADTPTMLYETSVIQWALLKFNGYDESMQFNNLADMLRENFKRMIVLGGDVANFDHLYEGWKILFSSIRGNIEEERTTRYLQEIATSAGFDTEYAYFDEVGFSETDGCFYRGQNYEFLFKLIPWENICIDEPDLAFIMSKMMQNKNTIFLNPAYTLLFQSKRILKFLWDLFPNHPLLLESSFVPLKGRSQVEKVAFGREGNNIKILDSHLEVLSEKPGEYGSYKTVYQEFVNMNSHNGSFYQPSVFFAHESCALGFRKGGLILDNYSKFVSHHIKS